MLHDLPDQARAEPRAVVRLSAYAFLRFWQVHAWAGVLTSLVVYLMFFLGSLVLFYRPLTVWEEPLLQSPAPEASSLQGALDLAQPLPEHFYYYLPKEQRGLPKIGYYLPGGSDWRMWWLDEASAQVIPQRELAAAYLYDLHYLWHKSTGFALQYGAGVLVFGFLLAIVTGVLIHLRGFFPQLRQFRPDKSERVLWSDLHKVAGSFGLPFQLIYALTGCLMALAPLIFELSVGPVFGGDVRAALATAGGLIDDPPPLDYGPVVKPISMDLAKQQALAALPGLEVESFVVHGYPRAEGTIDVRGPVAGQPFGDGVVQLSLRDGRLLSVETHAEESAVGKVVRYMHDLHTVEYGGLGVRFLILALALCGCATILSGNWIWLARRDQREPSFGNRALARMTAGVGAGVPFAVSVLLLASRLLPFEDPGRTDDEAALLALAFFAALVLAGVSAHPITTWWRLLALTGCVLWSLPLAATLRSTRGLFGAGSAHPTVLGVELAFLIAGALALAIALRLRVWHATQRAGA